MGLFSQLFMRVHHQSMRLSHGKTHECTVCRQVCCLPRANGVIVVVSGPFMVSVVFRLVRPWLFCNTGFCLHLFVARFWLAEVFAAVSCFLSCRVGGHFVASQNDGAQATCLIAAFGYKRPSRHARTSRVLGVGSQWHGCKRN